MTRMRYDRIIGGGRRRGIAFVVALAVIVMVATVLMVLTRHVQTESLASVNHGAAAETRWIAEGVARALVAELARDPQLAQAGREPETVQTQAGELGAGLYWLIRPDLDDEHRYEFGLVSEAGKMNINTADVRTLEALHPDVTMQIAESILLWRGDEPAEGALGSDSSYYLAQPRPYHIKESPFETPGEILLVRDVDRELLFGPVRAQRESFDSEPFSATHRHYGPGLQRGLYPLITVFSREPNRSFATGSERLNINSESRSSLAEVLRQQIDENRAEVLVGTIASQRPYRNMMDFLIRADLEVDEAAMLYDHLTTSDDGWLEGRVDVTTAPEVVLDALPGLEPGDGERLVRARATVDDPGASPLWMVEVLGPERAVEIGDLITTRSAQFSAEIVAVSGDGRAFHRLRVVIDVAPAFADGEPRIVHSEELTHLGWPLDGEIIDALRDGKSAAEVAREYRGRGQGF